MNKIEKANCMRCYFNQNGICKFYEKIGNDYDLMIKAIAEETECQFFISDNDVFESAFSVAIKKNVPKVEMKVEPYYDKEAMDKFFGMAKRCIDVADKVAVVVIDSLNEKKEENV